MHAGGVDDEEEERREVVAGHTTTEGRTGETEGHRMRGAATRQARLRWRTKVRVEAEEVKGREAGGHMVWQCSR